MSSHAEHLDMGAGVLLPQATAASNVEVLLMDMHKAAASVQDSMMQR